MAGLLDDFSEFIKTPGGQGLLSAAFGGLAGAQKGAPLNSLGRAGLAGLSGYGGALDREKQAAESAQMGKYRDMQQTQMQMQIDAAKRKATEEQGQADWRTGLPAVMNAKVYGAGDEGPTMAPADPSALKNYLMQPNSPFADEVLKNQLFPKAPDYKVVGDSLLQVGANGVTPVYTKPEKVNPNQPFMVVDGKIVPNTEYQNYEIGKAKAGATNVSTKVETKMGDSLASQVGPMVKDTYTAAQGAVQQADAAQRIIKAVDSGKIIAGPLANGRMTVAQIGQMVGVTGKDDAETIARSREVIRGLSEMTLQGRKQMTGQGAITESEGKLAEKANSGDINDLTPAEIKQLARASARAAKFIYSQHQDNLTNLQSNPDTSKLAGFYKVRPMPTVDIGEQPAVSVDDLVGKYRSK